MTAPAVRFAGVTRRFPGVVALNDVHFDIATDTCHAICGENGAGKSTLGRILAGLDRADAGSIELDGRVVALGDPRAAMAAGIAMVQQELAFCPNLSVGENLCLAALPARRGFVDEGAIDARARALLAAVGSTIDPATAMASLSIAEQQVVQIASAVGANAKIIIFDEPTSSLGVREAERLFELIGALKSRGATVVYVSHRISEIFRLCDAVTVLRDGAHVTTTAIGEIDEARLVESMIGRRIDQFFPAHADATCGEVLLDVRDLAVGGSAQRISFQLHAGEVVGLAGLVGAGRSEIAQALFGLDTEATGSVAVRGRPTRIRSARDAMALGIGYVPEDRKRQGLVLSMRNRENTSLPILSHLSSAGWVRAAAEREAVGLALSRVCMSAGQEGATARLSGGNQQKVVLAKWLAAQSEILILDEPTRGIDVGAKAELHRWIDGMASRGGAVLLISSDLPELLSLSSRILVLREGRLVGEVERADATQDRVLRLMSGLEADRAGAAA